MAINYYNFTATDHNNLIDNVKNRLVLNGWQEVFDDLVFTSYGYKRVVYLLKNKWLFVMSEENRENTINVGLIQADYTYRKALFEIYTTAYGVSLYPHLAEPYNPVYPKDCFMFVDNDVDSYLIGLNVTSGTNIYSFINFEMEMPPCVSSNISVGYRDFVTAYGLIDDPWENCNLIAYRLYVNDTYSGHLPSSTSVVKNGATYTNLSNIFNFLVNVDLNGIAPWSLDGRGGTRCFYLTGRNYFEDDINVVNARICSQSKDGFYWFYNDGYGSLFSPFSIAGNNYVFVPLRSQKEGILIRI